MSIFGKGERRHFGRRISNLTAHLVLRSMAPVPCIIRDLSLGGARVDLDVDFLLPSRFRLEIPSSGFDAYCTVRHQTDTTAGLEFTGSYSRSILEKMLELPVVAIPGSACLVKRPLCEDPSRRVAGRDLRQQIFARAVPAAKRGQPAPTSPAVLSAPAAAASAATQVAVVPAAIVAVEPECPRTPIQIAAAAAAQTLADGCAAPQM